MITKKEFNEMDDVQQWQWLLDQDDKSNIKITLDNDCTSIWIEETETLLMFDSWIGSSGGGAETLLGLLGFEVEYA